MVLNPAHHMMMLYICTKFQESISKGFRVIEGLWFVLVWSQFIKGHNSIKKIVDRVMVLNPAHHMMMLYICTKFQESISKGFRVIERMWFVLVCSQFIKGHNSIKKL